MLYDYGALRFDDELLGPNITVSTLEKAEKWLYVFAKQLGVPQGDIIRSFIIDELVAMYCYREVCMNKASSLAGQYSRNGETEDFYAKKMKFINDRIADLEKQITAEQLTGQPKKYNGYRAVPLYRGG